MKLSKRLLSLLLVCLLCFGLFSVNALAVENSENLIDSNLNNWVDFNDLSNIYTDIDIVYNSDSNLNYITIPSTDTVSLLYDLTDYITVGEKYVFRCYFPDTGNANYNSFQNCELSIGLVHIDDDGSVLDTVDDISFNITSSNYSSLNNDYLEISFEINKSIKNTAVAFAFAPSFSSGMPESHFYISNIELVRVESESEKKLDSILNWLQDIKNSITGVWQNITSSISSLGDRISSFFIELSNTIITKFNELSTNFSNYITNLGDRISVFFTDLIDNVRTFFEELPKKIFNYEIEVTDDDIISDGGSTGDGEDEEDDDSFNIIYSDFYTFNLNDIYSKSSGLEINYKTNDDYYTYYKNASKYGSVFACYSLPFELGKNIEISFNVFEFYCETGGWYLESFFVDDTGVWLEPFFSEEINGVGDYSFILPLTSFTSTEIESFDRLLVRIVSKGVVNSSSRIYFKNPCYRYLEYSNGSSDNDGSDNEGTTQKISWFQYLINKFKSWFSNLSNSIEGFFVKLFEDIKSLFIPSDGYFESLSNRFDLLIEERFGALVTITDYLVEFFSSFNADVTKEYFDVPIININLMGYNFPIGGWQVRFVPQFNGVEILINACKFISSVLATFAFFDGLKNKYLEVFGGGE